MVNRLKFDFGEFVSCSTCGAICRKNSVEMRCNHCGFDIKSEKEI
jgi:hypothetical protein